MIYLILHMLFYYDDYTTSDLKINSQKLVLGELKKRIEQHQEICKYFSSSNFKLETEIRFAEEQIKSLNIAIETIKLGDIEITKHHLLSKENKAEVFERTKQGMKKYESRWLAAKERYENIPIIRNIIELKNRHQTVQANINAFVEESKQLANKIEIKKNDSQAADRERIIKLAEYLVRERPKAIITINENDVKIKEVINEIELLEKVEIKNIDNVSHDEPVLLVPEKQSVERMNSEKDPMGLPKLHLLSSDLDIFSFKLDQINIIQSQNTTSIKRTLGTMENSPYNTEERNNKKYISPYFDISLNNKYKKIRNENFSEKKLIHILEDVTLDKTETYEIIKTLEVNQLQQTTYISSKNTEQYENISIANTLNEIDEQEPDQTTNPVQIEEINEEQMEIDHITNDNDLVDPPSQFKDVSQSSQEKKTVTFNIPSETEIPTLQELGGDLQDKSQVPMLNNSTASDDSYSTLKDKMLKNRNLDLSPQFVYSKPTLMPKQQEERVTSKFFESQNEAAPLSVMNDKDCNENLNQDQIFKSDENAHCSMDNKICTKDKNLIVVSSPKQEGMNLELPVSGFLFNHGPQGITDSLNLSISTTGYEDNEDFPHCLDSSLLLSPKADIAASVSSSQNHEVLSQGAPNFLGGFRKAALSFFGTNNTSDPKPQPDSGDFNFAFNKEEKKGRGGFFNMFH